MQQRPVFITKPHRKHNRFLLWETRVINNLVRQSVDEWRMRSVSAIGN